jgi:dTDP-4-amino-4,6-dideoxygalactose transaminase
MPDQVPFLDLTSPHAELEDELLAVVRNALRSGQFIGGPEVDSFEKEFAAFCNVARCIGVSSGTDALRFALLAVGVGRRDIVLTVPNSFIATTEAISQTGATFDFIDVEENTYNISVDGLRRYIMNRCTKGPGGGLIHKTMQRRVKAIVPVHLYGQMADMDPIIEMGERFGLAVIEDACQAHGAAYFSRRHNRWFRAGAMGDAAAFSFSPASNLGGCGEGGAVTTNDPEIAKKIRLLRDHGQEQMYRHEVEGYDGRLDAIQAAILRVKLRHLGAWNEKRRGAALLYNQMLRPHESIAIPYEPEWSRAIYHLYVIRTAERDVVQKRLLDAQIGTGLHYPVPLHLQNAYAGFGFTKGDYPAAEKAAGEILSLPMFPQLTRGQQESVVQVLIRSTAASAVSS